jgi:chemotaxis protein MotA
LELSTTLGVPVALAAVLIGMIFKGASPTMLLNPAAILIIIAGTAGAVLNAMPMHIVKKVPLLIKKVLLKQQLAEVSVLASTFVEFSQVARREGLLALEGRLSGISDPFMRGGLSMMIDGLDAEFIRDVMEAEIGAMEERHRHCATVFSQGGMYSPTLGVLGAVIGLVAALGNLSDIDQLGHSIAAAFIATMYGIFIGYVVCHPIANKLKILSAEEASVKRIIVEGILSLQAGDSPIAVESKLNAFLPQAERKTSSNTGG